MQAKVNHTNPSTNKMHSVLSPKILHKNVNGLSVDCRKADGVGLWGIAHTVGAPAIMDYLCEYQTENGVLLIDQFDRLNVQ